MTTGKVVFIITIYLVILIIMFVLVSVFYKPKEPAPVFRKNSDKQTLPTEENN